MNITPHKTYLPPLDTFLFSDCWLLFAIGFAKRGSTLKWILISGDNYNHDVFSLDELNYGMSKLIENGYVKKSRKRYVATEKAIEFYKNHSIRGEGHIEALMRMVEIFQKESAKSDCKLTIHFNTDSKGKIYTV